MEVIDKKYRNDCFFENLKIGAVFEHDDEYYIKSDNIDVDLHEQLYAVNLETGKTKRFAKDETVLLCSAKVYVG